MLAIREKSLHVISVAYIFERSMLFYRTFLGSPEPKISAYSEPSHRHFIDLETSHWLAP